MHIMPSDANCITTTNNVHTDSILYEWKNLYLIHTLIPKIKKVFKNLFKRLFKEYLTLFEWQVIWRVNKRNDKALESKYPGCMLGIKKTILESRL